MFALGKVTEEGGIWLLLAMLIVGSATLARTDIEEAPGEQPGMDNPGPPPGHVHQFEACEHPAVGEQVLVGEGFVRAGGNLIIGVTLPSDTDHCVAEGCPIEARCPEHNLPMALNTAQVVDWRAEPAGGQFGSYCGGVFDPDVPAHLVNCFWAPELPGIYHISAKIDDLPEDFEGAPLADEGAEWTEASAITVWEFAIGQPVNERPYHNQDRTFQARILPAQDHLERSLARVMQFRFTDVSREPGACLNVTDEAPDPAWSATTAADNDLKIEPGQEGFTIMAMEGPGSTNYDFAETTAPVELSPVLRVWCLDYGAWGELAACVRELPPGDPTEHTARRLVGNGLPMLDKYGAPWPVDEDGNHIWDGMEYGTGDPTSDDEPLPWGALVSGDGYTRYEEYRGWMVAGSFTSTDPLDQKDLFIVKRDAGEIPGGLLSVRLDLFQLGYVIHDGMWDSEVDYNPQGGMTLLCRYPGFAPGRTRHAVTVLRVYNQLEDEQIGETVRFADTGAVCRIDVRRLQQGEYDQQDADIATAHELGHAVYIITGTGGGHGHVPPKTGPACIMNHDLPDGGTVFCETGPPHEDGPCVSAHKLLGQQP